VIQAPSPVSTSALAARAVRRVRPIAVLLAALVPLLGAPGCVRIMQDEVGVKRRFGAVQDEILYPGMRGYNPFSTRVFRLKTRTVNLHITPDLPSREGLTVRSEMSILYRVEATRAPEVLRRIGVDYEESLILPVFRSASADVCASFYAKDMHSASRRIIEQQIQARMMEQLEERGFVIEAVLLKSVVLPDGLSAAIENKLQAEQVAQRMEFEIQRENAEAQRALIAAEAKRKMAIISAEAERDAAIIAAEGQRQAEVTRAAGTAAANDAITKSLTPAVLKYLQVEAFRELARSPNAKVIMTDGKTPVINLP
jgi:prohibitin 1